VATYVDPVVTMSPIEIDVDDEVVRELAAKADGRPLVIDYFSNRHGALTVGDFTVGFRDEALEPRYAEILPIAGVRTLVERHLIELIRQGATLQRRHGLLGGSLTVCLARPEHWIEFLERHPRRH
jgi:hypothetical protein